MKELVFSVEEIFNTNSKDGCLAQYESSKYYIPAYQRGYKWSSDENGAVAILLSDLWDAYQAYTQRQAKEYYLQYITVKPGYFLENETEVNYLEVIDGQQRLTTLSILLSVYAAIINKTNIADSKLHYAIRDNFFTNHIYPVDSIQQLCLKEWNELEKDPAFNKQDIFYMFHAVKKCYDFINKKIPTEHQEKFYDYLLGQVKLIVNSVEKHIQSETVFKNLNSNKVPLTESELIKGFLITKTGRINTKEQKANFKEILEVRANIGRKWDEINRWANDKRIRSFFFNNKDGMHQLLLLTAIRISDHKISKESNYPLFNFYHKHGKADQLFQLLKETQATLNDWFTDTNTYNLLGFCRFAKNSDKNKLSYLKLLLDEEDKGKLIDKLKSEKTRLLKCENGYHTLRYGEDDDNDKIHAILLALSVFSEGLEVRFDFHEFEQKNWSLEHIFPKSPEGKDKVLNEAEKGEILNMLGEKATEQIKMILQKEVRTDNEKQIYYKALKEHQHLNSIGNMCLLTSPDNSSNGCMFFAQKRVNILKLIRRGSFVPKHSFDVFSKMIDNIDNKDLSMWSKGDIEKHTEYIHSKLNN